MRVLVDVGLLFEAIRLAGYKGISQAAAAAKVAPSTFDKLIEGELPRLDSLQRICTTLKISERALILGIAKPDPKGGPKVVTIERRKLSKGDH